MNKKFALTSPPSHKWANFSLPLSLSFFFILWLMRKQFLVLKGFKSFKINNEISPVKTESTCLALDVSRDGIELIFDKKKSLKWNSWKFFFCFIFNQLLCWRKTLLEVELVGLGLLGWPGTIWGFRGTVESFSEIAESFEDDRELFEASRELFQCFKVAKIVQKPFQALNFS